MHRLRPDSALGASSKSRRSASREGGRSDGGQVDGVLVVNKPVGPTSHDIVACARRALGTSRIGHTGTLDPNASGVLPLVLGRATRLAQFLSGREKEYLATVRFGSSTDTYDLVGTVVRDHERVPARVEIETALAAFRGTFDQVPPPHSAKKVDGVRAYKHARAAVPVRLKPAAVTVTRLELLEMEGADVQLRVECSAGFYVRSLAHDLGHALGTAAHLAALTRTRAGMFTLERSVDITTLTERREEALEALLSMDELLPELSAVQLTPEGARRARHGQTLGPADVSRTLPSTESAVVRLMDPAGHLVGLARPDTVLGNAVTGTLHPSVIVG